MAESTTQPLQVLPVLSAVEYPILKRLGKQNIRKFIRERKAYEAEIGERNRQAGVCIGTPVSLKFSVDQSALESLIDLRIFGETVGSLSVLTDDLVHTWLDSNQEVKKDTLSASQVKSLVTKQLRISLTEKDPEQRVIMLFTDYTSLLRVNGLSWVIADRPDLAVSHILEAIKPKPLQRRLMDDLEFAHKPLKKNFRGFMTHVICRAQHFGEFEDSEETGTEKPSPYRPSSTSVGSRQNSPSGPLKSPAQTSTAAASATSTSRADKHRPDCLNPQCTQKHYLKECTLTSQERKAELYSERAQLRKQQGEQRTTRADTRTTSTSSPHHTIDNPRAACG
jgi:hypothetical protein